MSEYPFRNMHSSMIRDRDLFCLVGALSMKSYETKSIINITIVSKSSKLRHHQIAGPSIYPKTHPKKFKISLFFCIVLPPLALNTPFARANTLILDLLQV